jgi:hypothetical protein
MQEPITVVREVQEAAAVILVATTITAMEQDVPVSLEAAITIQATAVIQEAAAFLEIAVVLRHLHQAVAEAVLSVTAEAIPALQVQEAAAVVQKQLPAGVINCYFNSQFSKL